MDALRAAERFLVGYPEEADERLQQGRRDVLELLRDMEPGPSGVEETLRELAAARDYAPLQGTLPTTTQGLLRYDTRVAAAETLWAPLLPEEPSKPPDPKAESGRVNGQTLAPELPCEAPAILWSVFMGENSDPTDLERYVADHLRWWHPLPTVRALVTPLSGEVEQVAWVHAPTELQHWQVYVCVPWQVSLYAEDFVMVDAPSEW